jgi:uncharacterized protein YjbI with pentapeptide repeats
MATMANPEHLAIFEQGVPAWNAWRAANPEIFPNLEDVKTNNANLQGIDLHNGTMTGMNLHFADLRQANLAGGYFVRAYLGYANLENVDLRGANLTSAGLGWANLSGVDIRKARLESAGLDWANLTGARGQEAILSWANLDRAKCSGIDLREASLYHAICTDTDFSKADLRGADFSRSELRGADFRGANLSGANLTNANLVETNLEGADLTGCRVYGISAWNLNLKDAIQKDIVITPEAQHTIQVDRLEVAQFIYLLLNNAEIRYVIETVTSKVVLILGRFSPERKSVLDGLREALRQRNYLPVVFDFEKPASRDLTETVSTLAHLARFVIADITDARSIPQELMAIVPNLPSVPVQPLLLASQKEFAMFDDFRRYPWVLPMLLYENQEKLLGSLEQDLLLPVEAKVKEMAK